MQIDKELYRNALRQYQQWNAERASSQPQQSLSPTARWRRYVELVEFGQRLHPTQSAWQRAQKVTALELYYERLQQLEAWRNAHGK